MADNPSMASDGPGRSVGRWRRPQTCGLYTAHVVRVIGQMRRSVLQLGVIADAANVTGGSNIGCELWVLRLCSGKLLSLIDDRGLVCSDDALWAKIHSTSIHHFRHLSIFSRKRSFILKYYTNMFLAIALNAIEVHVR